MRRTIFAFCILVLAVIMLTQCTTRYQLGRKHINKGQSYHDRGKHIKSLKEFSKALTATGTNPSDYELAYLLAVLYHRLYIIDVTKHWTDLAPVNRTYLETLGKVINQTTTQKIDLLEQAFTNILRLEQKKEGLPPKKLEPWLLVQKEMILGDILFREGRESKNPLSPDQALKVDEFLIANIRRYILYELARTFYLSAWLRTKETSLRATYLSEELQLRLKEIYESLVTVSNTLSYQKRDKKFTNKFKSRTQNYWEILKGMEDKSSSEVHPSDTPTYLQQARLPRPDGIPSLRSGTARQTRLPARQASVVGEQMCDRIRKSLNRELLILDPLFHFNTGRVKLSLAIEEILADKSSKAMDSLLASLAHFTMAEQLRLHSIKPQETTLLNNGLNDIYLRLHRLSLPR